MPPNTRPQSGVHTPDPTGEDTRIKVAVLETRLAAIEETVRETRSELREQIAQLGADLGGLATKEEVRQLSKDVEGVRSAVDRLIGACKRNAQCATTEPMHRHNDKDPATTKDEGDITVKALFWNCTVAGLKLIGAGIVVGLIVLAINAKQFGDSVPTIPKPAAGGPAHPAPAGPAGAAGGTVAPAP